MKRFVAIFALLAVACYMTAEEITYKIVAYNADAGDFTLSAWGERPVGAEAYFVNEYGATSGNRYNQIPRNREAQLVLLGWEGCTIKRVTLSMCSNNKAGSFALIVTTGEQTLLNTGTHDFCDETWYGRWVSKDLGVYVNLPKDMTSLTPVATDDDVTICIKGGTREGSVYVNAITIEYEPAVGVSMESPMGYAYEKMVPKQTLNAGDVIMLYRSGNAAGDIDGMETAHYLDAVGITNVSNVNEMNVEHFTLGRDESDSYWTLTDQYGRQLGAGSSQLLWDEGVQTWNITLDYSGAVIASSNEKYGTMRFNTPTESWARFAMYTSKSLPLPYIYRRVRQNQPVLSTSVQLSETERTVTLAQDTVVVKARLMPTNTTDCRVDWQGDNDAVATVKDGIVELKSAGDVRITAIAHDSGVEASVLLHVVAGETAIRGIAPQERLSVRYDLMGIRKDRTRGLVVEDGRKWIEK